jgi:hypothetical protein
MLSFRPRLLLLLASLVLSAGAWARPAQAIQFFSSDDNSTLNLTKEAENQNFTLNFDGRIKGETVLGLASEAIITFLGFQNSNDTSTAQFSVKLSNTSFEDITSRTSIFGFNLDAVDEMGQSLSLLDTTVSGLFNRVGSGNVPGIESDAEVCFSHANGNGKNKGANCAGGGNGGVSTGESSEFKFDLQFSGIVSSLSFTDFFVRYQSIEGSDKGTSGVGGVAPNGSRDWLESKDSDSHLW